MKLISSCFLIIITSFSLFGQETKILNSKILDSLMIENQFQKAESILSQQLEYIKSQNLNDSLYKYVYFVGKIELQKSNAQTASKKSDAILDYLISKTNNKRTHYRALLKSSDFYDEIGNNQKSLEVTTRALEVIKEVKDATPEEVGKIEYNIGATLLTLGNLNEAKINFQKALVHFEGYGNTSKLQLSDGYNAVGATMWMSSKLDSAKYYFSKAVKTIETDKGDPILNLYLGSVIQSNISLLEYGQGNLDKAIAIQSEVISNYGTAIKSLKDENLVSKAKRFQLRAIANMAVFCNEQGNLQKAHDLLLYTYQKKKHFRESNDAELGSTLIQIGQSSISLQNYDEALNYLQQGLDQFETISIENPYWRAAGYHAMAEAYVAKKSIDSAKKYYDKSEILFREALGEDYAIELLSFFRNKSLFLAENQEYDEALHTAEASYSYVLNNGGKDNFTLVKQILNLAKVNYKLKNYQKTLEWVEKANEYLSNSAATADSKQRAFNKPQLIVLKSLAEYELQPNKNVDFLNKIVNQLDVATSNLEERKTTVFKNEDISILMSDYQEISNFSKKITLELFQKTKNPNYLNKLITLNESAIYNRIRTRLNLKNTMSFNTIPNSVLEREMAIKKMMSTSLENSRSIHDFFEVEQQWHSFLDSLKDQYPKYFKMRYATIEEPMENLQKSISDNLTIVRYIDIDDALYAIIINKTKKHLVKLYPKNLTNTISKLSKGLWDINESSQLFYDLYQQLWQPFESKIKTTKVIIIPNGQLFNLSFESLTPKRISNFHELESHSLLSKYTISYNYSLLLTDGAKSKTVFSNNFIAFAPEFSSKMKSDYQLAISDSIVIDKTYLTLLPQPFSKNLAKKSSQIFKGSYFINDNASKHIFTQEAKEHKIIHIGTHAESNNVSPELSRLIFAKNVSDTISSEDNSLYTYEIYNQNLSSNLAILTACETGKPTYQAGEGMISLAHAFNYAGSESILTSLWQIDEQSSAQIIEHFYGYLKEGLPKDEALQKAKLDYLSTAKGRTLAPQYWAGLVLIGDTSPIDLQSPTSWIFWLLGSLVIIGIIFFLLSKRQRT